MAQPEIIKDIDARVKDTGDTMTGNLTAPTFIGTLEGNASSADKLNTSAGSPRQPVYFDNSGQPILAANDYVFYDEVSTGSLPNNTDLFVLKSGDVMTGNLTAPTFIGSLRGNADTATKASQDSDGAVISSTYLKLSGGIMTGPITLASKGYQTNNAAGYYTDEYGNFVHSQAETKDHWHIDNNAKTISLKYYFETGNLSIQGTMTAPTFIGNLEGNATTATKATQDENGKNIVSTYRPLRRNICGQSEGTITNPWYKFASIIITGAYEDRTITFKISQGYSDNAKMSGILTAHIRTTNPVGFENAQLIWEYANDSIVTSDWVLAYLSTSGTDCKVELWCKQDAAWSQYHFEVLSCHDRTGWRDDWVLYNTQSAGSASGPTSGYTQIESVYGVLRASAVYGAVWNDYAEFRSSDPIESGRVICETGDGTLKLSTERLQPGANVVSDTFGFAIGETENCKTPIAVSGRALVYTYEDRYSYEAGDPVCAAPGGTVSKMSREEVMMYPDRIVGIVSEIPEYERWGTGNVEVKNRIWIKVK